MSCGALRLPPAPVAVDEESLGLRSALTISCGPEGFTRGKELVLAGSLGYPQCSSEVEEEPRAGGIGLGPEVESASVEAGRHRERVEGGCAIPGAPQRHERSRCNLRRHEARSAHEVECARVMVRDELRLVVRPAERLHPPCDAKMSLRPRRPWDRRVRRVAHEGVPEGPFRLARDGRVRRTSQQSLPLEGPQALLDRPAIVSAGCSDGSGPEHTPDHRGVLHSSLLVLRQRIKTGGDERLHRVRYGLVAAALADHPHVLLREQGVTTRLLEERRPRLGRDIRDREQLLDQRCGVLVGERLQAQHGLTLARSPARPALEKLGSCGGDHEDGDVGQPLSERGHEVEQSVVRPVEVLEDEDERAHAGQRLDVPAPGCEALGPPVVPFPLLFEAQQRSDVPAQPVDVVDVE